MFRVAKIVDLNDGLLNEESFSVEDAFFFTISVKDYYVFYNKLAEVIGIVPVGYNMFFKIDSSPVLEDIDIDNVLRLYEQGMEFYLASTTANSNKISFIDSRDISRIQFVEDDEIKIPFTNFAFDSDGIVVFKNITAMADTINETVY